MVRKYDELDIRDILSLIRERWWIILIIMCVSVIITSVYTLVTFEPVYSADTTIYVGSEADSKTQIVYNDLMVADRLVNDYRQLIKSRSVTGRVIEELGLKMSAAGLAGKIDVKSLQDTRIIQITVRDVEPQKAKDIANKVAAVFQEKAADIMKIENVQVIDTAILPTAPINVNTRNNILLSAAFGLVLGVALIFLIEYLDRTVKTPQDVKNAIDLPVLGMIPVFDEVKK